MLSACVSRNPDSPCSSSCGAPYTQLSDHVLLSLLSVQLCSLLSSVSTPVARRATSPSDYGSRFLTVLPPNIVYLSTAGGIYFYVFNAVILSLLQLFQWLSDYSEDQVQSPYDICPSLARWPSVLSFLWFSASPSSRSLDT